MIICVCVLDVDDSWTDELESHDECSERGYCGLIWLMQQREQNIMVVCHGGLLNYTMNNHSRVVLADKRDMQDGQERRCITKRFGNCEMREFRMALVWDSDDFSMYGKDKECKQENGEKSRPMIIMEEVTMEMDDSYAMTDDDNASMS